MLERGRVAERGRAASLAAAGGTFARLLALQRVALRDDAFPIGGECLLKGVMARVSLGPLPCDSVSWGTFAGVPPFNPAADQAILSP